MIKHTPSLYLVLAKRRGRGHSSRTTHKKLCNIRKKTHSEKQHLVNSRFELLKTGQQFCGDISTLFESPILSNQSDFDNDFEIESKHHRKIVVLFFKSSNLEFRRCCLSERVFFLYFIKLSAGKGLQECAVSSPCSLSPEQFDLDFR